MKTVSSARRARLNAVAKAHDAWVEENLSEVGFHPAEYPKPGSDYNQHYLDVEATGEMEDELAAMIAAEPLTAAGDPDWEESEHPRGSDGQFIKKGTSGQSIDVLQAEIDKYDKVLSSEQVPQWIKDAAVNQKQINQNKIKQAKTAKTKQGNAKKANLANNIADLKKKIAAAQTEVDVAYLKDDQYGVTTGKEMISYYQSELSALEEKSDQSISATTPLAPKAASKFTILPESERGLSGDGYYAPGIWGRYGAAGLLMRNVDDKGVERFLLVQNTLNQSHMYKWQLPGGAIDEKETPEQGAAREVFEELQFDQAYLNKLQPHGTHAVTVPVTGKDPWTYSNIVVDAPTMMTPKIDKSELGGADWFTRAQIEDMRKQGSIIAPLAAELDKVLGKYGGAPAPTNSVGGVSKVSKPKAPKAPAKSTTVSKPASTKTTTSMQGAPITAWTKALYGTHEHGQIVAVKSDGYEQYRISWDAGNKKFLLETKQGYSSWYPEQYFGKKEAYQAYKEATGWSSPPKGEENVWGSEKTAPAPPNAPAPSVSKTSASAPVIPAVAKFKAQQKQKQLTVQQIEKLKGVPPKTLSKDQLHAFMYQFKRAHPSGPVHEHTENMPRLFAALTMAVVKHNASNSPKLNLLQAMNLADTFNTQVFKKKIDQKGDLLLWLKTAKGKQQGEAILASGGHPSTVPTDPSYMAQNAADNTMIPAWDIGEPKTGPANFKVLSLSDVIDLQEEMESKYGALSAEQKTAAYEYTKDPDNFNRPLRGKEPFTPSTAQGVADLQESMRPSTQPITVWRAVDGLGAELNASSISSLEDLKAFEGALVNDPSFLSTSYSYGVFGSYGKFFNLQINIPEGTPIISMHGYGHPNFQHENEILLAAGMTYRVDGVEKGPFGGEVFTVHLTVVPTPEGMRNGSV